MKPAWTIIISVVLTLAIIGAAGYFYGYKKVTNEKNNLQSQVNDLDAKVNDLKSAASAPAATTGSTSTAITTDTSETANWKTYSNTSYGMTFKYPDTWSFTEKAENYNDARKYLVMLTGSVTGRSYNAEVFTSTETPANFVKDYFGKLEAGPSAISTATVASQTVTKFFMAKASTTPGGAAYIMFQKGTNYVAFSVSGQGTQAALMADVNLANITSNFVFN
jgi:hypothetical protein